MASQTPAASAAASGLHRTSSVTSSRSESSSPPRNHQNTGLALHTTGFIDGLARVKAAVYGVFRPSIKYIRLTQKDLQSNLKSKEASTGEAAAAEAANAETIPAVWVQNTSDLQKSICAKYQGADNLSNSNTAFKLNNFLGDNNIPDVLARGMAFDKQSLHLELAGAKYSLHPKLMFDPQAQKKTVKWIMVEHNTSIGAKSLGLAHSLNAAIDKLLKNSKLDGLPENLTANVVRSYTLGHTFNKIKKFFNVLKSYSNAQSLKIFSQFNVEHILNASPNDIQNYRLKKFAELLSGKMDTVDELRECMRKNAAFFVELQQNPKRDIYKMAKSFHHTFGMTNVSAYDLDKAILCTDKGDQTWSQRGNGEAVIQAFLGQIKYASAHNEGKVKFIINAKAVPDAFINVGKPNHDPKELERIKTSFPKLGSSKSSASSENNAADADGTNSDDSSSKSPKLLRWNAGRYSADLIAADVDQLLEKPGLVSLTPQKIRPLIITLDDQQFELGADEYFDHKQILLRPLNGTGGGFVLTKNVDGLTQETLIKKLNEFKKEHKAKKMHVFLDLDHVSEDIKRDVLRFSYKVKTKDPVSSLAMQINRDQSPWSLKRHDDAYTNLIKLENAREDLHNEKKRGDGSLLYMIYNKLNFFSPRNTAYRKMGFYLRKAVFNKEDKWYRFVGHLFGGATQPQDTAGAHALRSIAGTGSGAFNMPEYQFLIGIALDPVLQVLADYVQEVATNGLVAPSDSVMRGRRMTYEQIKEKKEKFIKATNLLNQEAERIEKLLKSKNELEPDDLKLFGQECTDKVDLLKKFDLILKTHTKAAAFFALTLGSKQYFDMSKFVLEQLTQNMVRIAWSLFLSAGGTAALVEAFDLKGITELKRLPDLTLRRIFQSFAGGLDSWLRFSYIIKDHAKSPKQILRSEFEDYGLDALIHHLNKDDIDKIIMYVCDKKQMSVSIPLSTPNPDSAIFNKKNKNKSREDIKYKVLSAIEIEAVYDYKLHQNAGDLSETQKALFKTLGLIDLETNAIDNKAVHELWEQIRVRLMYDPDGLRTIRQEYTSQRISITQDVVNDEYNYAFSKLQAVKTNIDSYVLEGGMNYNAPDSIKQKKLARLRNEEIKYTAEVNAIKRQTELFHQGLAYMQATGKNRFKKQYLKFDGQVDEKWAHAWDTLREEFPDSRIEKTLRTGGEEWLRSTKIILRRFIQGLGQFNEIFMEFMFRFANAPVWALTQSENFWLGGKGMDQALHHISDNGKASLAGSLIMAGSFATSISMSVGLYFKNMAELNIDQMSGPALESVIASSQTMMAEIREKILKREKAIAELNKSEVKKAKELKELGTLQEELDLCKKSILFVAATLDQFLLQRKNNSLQLLRMPRFKINEAGDIEEFDKNGQLINQDENPLHTRIGLNNTGEIYAISLEHFETPLIKGDDASIEDLSLSSNFNSIKDNLSKNVITTYSQYVGMAQCGSKSANAYEMPTAEDSNGQGAFRKFLNIFLLKPETKGFKSLLHQSIVGLSVEVSKDVHTELHRARKTHIKKDKNGGGTPLSIMRDNFKNAEACVKLQNNYSKDALEKVGEDQTPSKVLAHLFKSLYKYPEGSEKRLKAIHNYGHLERDGMLHIRQHFIEKVKNDWQNIYQQLSKVEREISDKNLAIKNAIKYRNPASQQKLEQELNELLHQKNTLTYTCNEFKSFLNSELVQNFDNFPFNNLGSVDYAKDGKTKPVNFKLSQSSFFSLSYPCPMVRRYDEGKFAFGLRKYSVLMYNGVSSIFSPNHGGSLLVKAVGVWYKDHWLWARAVPTMASLVFGIFNYTRLASAANKTRKDNQSLHSSKAVIALTTQKMQDDTVKIDTAVTKILALIKHIGDTFLKDANNNISELMRQYHTLEYKNGEPLSGDGRINFSEVYKEFTDLVASSNHTSVDFKRRYHRSRPHADQFDQSFTDNVLGSKKHDLFITYLQKKLQDDEGFKALSKADQIEKEKEVMFLFVLFASIHQQRNLVSEVNDLVRKDAELKVAEQDRLRGEGAIYTGQERIEQIKKISEELKIEHQEMIADSTEASENYLRSIKPSLYESAKDYWQKFAQSHHPSFQIPAYRPNNTPSRDLKMALNK